MSLQTFVRMKTNSLFHLVIALFCSGLFPSPSAQERPSLRTSAGQNGIFLEWDARQSSAAPALLKYQLEQSLDLRSWSAFSSPIRSSATNQSFSRLLSPSAGTAFYRLSVTPDSVSSALGSGGESVFGYKDAFANALQEIGQISPAQFAARYPQPDYLPAIAWDPTTAEFWDAFNIDPAVYNVGLVPGLDDLRHFDFRLNAEELAAFKKNGFVVSERLGTYSCGEIYSRIWIDDLPVFITSDSLLHAWHRSYDLMLAELEQGILVTNFQKILDGMAGAIPAAAAQSPSVLHDSLLDADYFIAVARSLLAGQNVASKLGQDARVQTTLNSVNGLQLDTCFNLFGEPRGVDFSQFQPRGHYLDYPFYYPPFTNYFRCLMWLGRIDLRIAGGPYMDSDCTPEHMAPTRELGAAIILNQLLRDSGQFNRWQRSERLISAFVGWTDSMTFAQLGDLLEAAGIHRLADIADLNTLLNFQSLLQTGTVGAQNINSDYFVSPLGGPPAALPQSFTVFGQKFTLDSWAFSQVVADRILWVENGQTNKVDRRVPSALDVAFSVLGNNQIVPNLSARMSNATGATNYPAPFRDGLNYQHNLAAVRMVIEQQPSSAWRQNIYMNWLDSLREISTPLANDARQPDALRTRAWAMKDVNTQLASWTELRHDTVLYLKQSYTSTYLCSYPKGFVEPRPAFWQRLAEMADTVAALLRDTDYGPQTKIQTAQLAFLAHFSDVSRTLQAMSEKELRQEPFSRAEEDFVSSTLEGQRVYGGGWSALDGWYPTIFYHSSYAQSQQLTFDAVYGAVNWDALITDVHTDVPCEVCRDPGSVLHEALGNANLLLIAVNNGTDRCVYAGPVMSHFEFPVIGVTGSPTRLTDQDWRIRMARAGLSASSDGSLAPYRGNDPSQMPPPPDWTSGYLVPKEKR